MGIRNVGFILKSKELKIINPYSSSLYALQQVSMPVKYQMLSFSPQPVLFLLLHGHLRLRQQYSTTYEHTHCPRELRILCCTSIRDYSVHLHVLVQQQVSTIVLLLYNFWELHVLPCASFLDYSVLVHVLVQQQM